MVQLSDEQFNSILGDALDEIPKRYRDSLDNVAFILEEEPTEEQRRRLNLQPYQSLFGLYEGVPLPQRMGTTKLLPDKITFFRRPLEYASQDVADLTAKIRNTVWHEVAHFFGLDHTMIHRLEGRDS